MKATLETLLHRIRAGLASDLECAQARRLAADDARLPAGLDDLFTDDAPADADALLGMIGTADAPLGDLGQTLRAAVASELAMPVPRVDDAVLAALGTPSVDVRGAVLAESGRVSVAGAVDGALGLDAALPVAAALRAEAGVPPILFQTGAPAPWADSAHELDHVGAAIAEEAGTVDLGADVLGSLALPASVPVAAALGTEAGRVDVLDAVLGSLGIPREQADLAMAVRAEAGTLDIADQVALTLAPEALAGLLDHELSPATHRLVSQGLLRDPQQGLALTAMADLARDLCAAVADEAGPAVDLWEHVARAIGIAHPEQVEGWDPQLFADAVRDGAGQVHIGDAVMAQVAHLDRVARDMPLAALRDEPLAAAANVQRYSWGAMVMAMVALLVVGATQLLPMTRGAATDAPTIASLASSDELVFASAAEVVVENLEFDGDVQVGQAEGDEGALIIWVDEEAV